MIRSLRSGFLGLFLVGTLIIGASSVGAATATATLTGGTLSITAPASDFTYTATLTVTLVSGP